MNRLNSLVPWHQQLLHRYKSLRWVPLRRKWFVGYDLDGNTYWEFRLSSSLPMRRAVEYRTKRQYLGEYTECEVPPRWMAWLRYTRDSRPSLQELILEEQRIEKMKVLGKLADEKWRKQSTRAVDSEIMDKVKEIRGILQEKDSLDIPQKRLDPKFIQDDPIESAKIQPRR